MSISTRGGDDGSTGLQYGSRVPKTDLRIAACGEIDELNSAMGVARAASTLPLVKEHLLAVQKNLVPLMGQVAVPEEDLPRYRSDARFPKLAPADLAALDELVAKLEAQSISFRGWATPGETLPAAHLDLARSICRRAERSVVAIESRNIPEISLVLQYLNRLSDVLWLLARYTETVQSCDASH